MADPEINIGIGKAGVIFVMGMSTFICQSIREQQKMAMFWSMCSLRRKRLGVLFFRTKSFTTAINNARIIGQRILMCLRDNNISNIITASMDGQVSARNGIALIAV